MPTNAVTLRMLIKLNFDSERLEKLTKIKRNRFSMFRIVFVKRTQSIYHILLLQYKQYDMHRK